MKKIVLFAITVLTTTVASAETGTSGISDAADGVVTYMPYVRALCYVIAAIIAIVGAVAVYYSMQTSPQNTTKGIVMTAGGALTFVCLSLALPQFFGIDDSVSGGSSSNRTSSIGTRQYTSNGTSFLVSDEGGISQTGIQVSIPELNDNHPHAVFWYKQPRLCKYLHRLLQSDWRQYGNYEPRNNKGLSKCPRMVCLWQDLQRLHGVHDHTGAEQSKDCHTLIKSDNYARIS